MSITVNWNFDTLEAVKRLEVKGFTRQQAEEVVNVVKDAQNELVTKGDLRYLKLQIFTAMIIMTVIIKPEVVSNLFHLLKI